MIIRAGRPALLFGPVAQLGERTVRIRKVESSILFVSTKKYPHTDRLYADTFYLKLKRTKNISLRLMRSLYLGSSVYIPGTP